MLRKNKLYNDIYLNILEGIMNGDYTSSEKLPSVRELAKKYQANPQTVQKAYQVLEGKKLVISKVGSGKFLTENKEVIKKFKKEFLEEFVVEIKGKIKKFNLDILEVSQKLEEEEHENE